MFFLRKRANESRFEELLAELHAEIGHAVRFDQLPEHLLRSTVVAKSKVCPGGVVTVHVLIEAGKPERPKPELRVVASNDLQP